MVNILHVPSAHYRQGAPARRLGDVWQVVLHSTESDDRPFPGTAERLAVAMAKAKNRTDPKTGLFKWAPSYHYLVDNAGAAQSLLETQIGRGVPPNEHTIHVAIIGRALVTEWASEPAFHLAAELVRGIHGRWGLPPVRVTAAELRLDQRAHKGDATHAAFTDAFRRSDHQDPGGKNDARWPWEQWLALVAEVPPCPA